MDIRIGDILGGCAMVGVVYLIVKDFRKDNKFNEAIEKIADGIDVNVDNLVIEKAVEKAVNRETAIQVDKACTRAVASIRSDISSKVKAAVDAEERSLKENTKKEIAKRIDNIDISKAQQEVIDDAQQIVADRFEEDLAGIRKTYETTIKKAADMCSDILAMSAQQTNINTVAKNVNDATKTIISIMEKV